MIIQSEKTLQQLMNIVDVDPGRYNDVIIYVEVPMYSD